MCTFSETKPARPPRLSRLRSALRSRLPHGRGEDGFLLVEVLVSAMLVALIVTATFNGLDVAHRLTADQRRHDQASILASQSQEQLRSEPASALNALVSSPHKYTKTVGGTTYTITQEAKNVGASGKTTGCSVTETKAQTGTNFQTSSTVTWKSQEKAKRPAVKASGIVTPPTGSAVEIDVINGLNEGVSGVTAKATFIPFEAGSYNTVEGTTGNAGCVVLTGIQSTSATIEIVEKTGFVMPSGALKVPSKEIAIAPNITTHYTVQYAEAGRIAAHFTYKGETTWEGKEVVGDTFVAYNTNIGIKPEYETGATYFKYEATGEEKFLPLTAKALASATPSQKPYLYEPIAWTAAGSKYPNGDLFPFKEKWLVYGGDCSANNTGAEARVEAGPVKSGETTNVNVPLSFTKLTIWTGASSTKKGEPTSKRYGPAKITNTECESATTPPNATGIAFTHEQKETLPEGRLEEPFQPFGNNFKLCVVNSELKKRYTVPFSNTTVAGSTPNIYIGQRSSAEQTTRKTELKTAEEKLNKEESEAKTAKEKREKEESEAKTAKEKRVKEEKEMGEKKTAREKEEAEKRATWKKQEEKKEISKAQRETKEKEQTKTREKIEKEEKEAKEKREKEETEAAKAKEKREKEETEAATKKTEREAAKAKVKKETEENTTLEKEEGETGVTVEAGTSC
jgi:Tfp pilus assembly protein PilV